MKNNKKTAKQLIIQQLWGTLAEILVDRVEPLFEGPNRISLLCRNPAYPDGSRDVLVTNEKDLEDAIKALRILGKSPEEQTFSGLRSTGPRFTEQSYADKRFKHAREHPDDVDF